MTLEHNNTNSNSNHSSSSSSNTTAENPGGRGRSSRRSSSNNYHVPSGASEDEDDYADDDDFLPTLTEEEGGGSPTGSPIAAEATTAGVTTSTTNKTTPEQPPPPLSSGHGRRRVSWFNDNSTSSTSSASPQPLPHSFGSYTSPLTSSTTTTTTKRNSSSNSSGSGSGTTTTRNRKGPRRTSSIIDTSNGNTSTTRGSSSGGTTATTTTSSARRRSPPVPPLTTTSSSRRPRPPISFSDVLQQRSDVLRSRVFPGLLPRTNSSISSSRASSSSGSSALSGHSGSSGSRYAYSRYGQHDGTTDGARVVAGSGSTSGSGGNHPTSRSPSHTPSYGRYTHYSQYSKAKATAKTSTTPAVRVYRGYKMEEYALVMRAERSCLVPTNGTESSTIPAAPLSSTTTTASLENSTNRTTKEGTELVVDHTAVVEDGALSSNSRKGRSIPCPSILVNKHGYPYGEGTTQSEQQGPYLYLLIKIKTIHYEENEVFWTVTRQDTQAEMRGDAGDMTTIATKAGLVAAMRTAKLNQRRAAEHANCNDPDLFRGGGIDDATDSLDNRTLFQKIQTTMVNCFCIVFCLPVFCIYEVYLMTKESDTYAAIIHNSRLFLNGIEPFKISCRITSVNIIVGCSIWYLFADQVRLIIPFQSVERDYIVAWINFFVWLVIVLELCFQVFIRPDGWYGLVRSDQAFTPQTARYINGVHLFVETLSVILYIPVFLCIFQDKTVCSDRLTDLSYYSSTLATVIGPTWLDVFIGRTIFFLIRFRVFGLVRHWRNRWLKITFLDERKYKKMKRKKKVLYRQRQFILSDDTDLDTAATSDGDDDDDSIDALFDESDFYAADRDDMQYHGNQPRRRPTRNSSYVEEQVSKHTEMIEMIEANQREDAKKKASNIGTALMVVNSYRALLILCCITGLFPMLFNISQEVGKERSTNEMVVNPAGYDSVRYLQTINLQVPTDAQADDDDGGFHCNYLRNSVAAWINSLDPYYANYFGKKKKGEEYISLLSVSIRPARCYAQFNGTMIDHLKFHVNASCPLWSDISGQYDSGCIFGNAINITFRERNKHDIAEKLNIRGGSIETYTDPQHQRALMKYKPVLPSTNTNTYEVSASFNYTYTVTHSAVNTVIVELLLLILTLSSLKLLRIDAIHYALGPLRSMLRIVARYAKNPLAQSSLDDVVNDKKTNPNNGTGRLTVSDSGSYATDENDDDNSDKENKVVKNIDRTCETEQLVTAVSKITDLLRKCWGVAGADIISTNLASRNGDYEVFNPMVPGKNVFGLFAFAQICNFDHALRNLSGDVMILINDVAAVLHGEVFRWGFGDSGQCNKNLGSAFFMVFKIGSVTDTIEKLEQAAKVVFSTGAGKQVTVKKRTRNFSVAAQRTRSRAGSSIGSRSSSMDRMKDAPTFVKGLTRKLHAKKDVAMEAMEAARSLSLLQIPGIQRFADRAVIGMLKTLAAVHRDTMLRAWAQDFRLSSGVGTWSVDMIFGMHAGWAVEGAVGSEYKIDATYLSPHVNMASRMMSASKHYGVNILISESLQELMSEPARNKMRNLDRVTVKGSNAIQKIYTYDCRSLGADFFLYNISDEQAEEQARNYASSIWDTDADLKAMRHHVTEEFEFEFMAGMKHYYDGEWPSAIAHFKAANRIMIETAREAGYLHEDASLSKNDQWELYSRETFDRPSRYLINFMKSKGNKAPDDWDGWHPLLSK